MSTKWSEETAEIVAHARLSAAALATTVGKAKIRNMAKPKITVQGVEIRIQENEYGEFVCITDIAQISDARASQLVQNWLRSKSTVEFLGFWELANNPRFKTLEFEYFKNQSGSNSFLLAVNDWVERTDALGITSKAGRYGGTFAHFDIAINFCNWLSAEFYVHFVKQFRLYNEAVKISDRWDLRRQLAKANYHIHTDAIRENLVPQLDWQTKRESIHFASEADLLNMAIFGITAKQWKAANPEKKGNIRDDATTEELQVLANMESLNAALMSQGFNQEERLAILTKRAEREVEVLNASKAMQEVKKLEK
jgi:hypothetical protein